MQLSDFKESAMGKRQNYGLKAWHISILVTFGRFLLAINWLNKIFIDIFLQTKSIDT